MVQGLKDPVYAPDPKSGVIVPNKELVEGNATSPVPVSLIANPFAHQFAYASQMGVCSIGGVDANPLTPFLDFLQMGYLLNSGDRALGQFVSPVALVVLNSLTRPLALVDFYERWTGGYQLAYSALLDPDPLLANRPSGTGSAASLAARAAMAAGGAVGGAAAASVAGNTPQDPAKVNQIPAASAYPHSAAHRTPEGGVAMMGGLGVFAHILQEADGSSTAGCAWSFAHHQDEKGKFIGPFIGVACWTERRPIPNEVNEYTLQDVHSAVTADVGKYGSLKDFYQKCTANLTESTTEAMSTTAWCCHEPMDDLKAGGISFAPLKMRRVPSAWPGPTLTLWVRDLSSTLG